MQKSIRPIAIYLPQFHPIHENDQWWGKGFTEWTNVVSARPRFKGHYQPHLPADLGFYDLRLPEVREAQAELASRYNIFGFCYYHYWFNGRRILERPFDEVFSSGKPNFPFMLCWANENWTRIWDGGENSVLLKQEYSIEDDERHINYLIKFFKDPRYIRINNRPVFAVYKDGLFPDIGKTIEIFRRECRKQNLEIYLCNFVRQRGSSSVAANFGFDAAIDFQPLSVSKTEYLANRRAEHSRFVSLKWYYNKMAKILNRQTNFNDEIIDMKEFVSFDLSRPLRERTFPCVSPSWDNSSRRKDRKAMIFTNSSPNVFKQWVTGKVKHFTPFSEEENLFFINAWNEWAEGNHLEPDQKYGHQFLEGLRDGIRDGLID